MAERQLNTQEIVDRTLVNYKVLDLIESLIKACNIFAGEYNASITTLAQLLRIEKTENGFNLYKGKGVVHADFAINDRYDRMVISRRQSTVPLEAANDRQLYIVDMGDEMVLKTTRENTSSCTPIEAIAYETCLWVTEARELS